MITCFIALYLISIILLTIAFVCTLVYVCHSINDDESSSYNYSIRNGSKYVTYADFLDELVDVYSSLSDIRLDIICLRDSIPKKYRRAVKSKKEK